MNTVDKIVNDIAKKLANAIVEASNYKVQNLLAYVILKDGVKEQFEREIDITKAIKEDLEHIMMSYMMPSKFLYRDSLPLTPNGKIDIKGLISEVNNR